MVRTKKTWIHIAIMMILTFGIGYLPPVGDITPFGMKILGVFVGLMYAWIFIELYWSCLFGFVAMVIVGHSNIMGVFLSGMGSYMVMLLLICSVMGAVVNQTGLTETIIGWFATKKAFTKSPWTLIVAIIALVVVLGILGAGFVAIFLLWDLSKRICDANGEPPKSKLRSMMVALIVMIAIYSMNSMPFGGGVVMIAAYLTAATGVTIAYVPYFVNYIIWLAVQVVGILLVSKYILKVDVSGFQMTDEIRAQYSGKPWTKKQILAIVLMVVYTILLFGSQLSTFAPFAFAAKMGVIGMSILTIVILGIIPNDDGREMDFAVAFKGIPWASLLLIAVTVPLSAAMESDASGIMLTVRNVCMPIFVEMGPTLLLAVATIVLVTMTQVLHNLVLHILFIPFLGGIMIQLGGNPSTLFFLLYVGLNCAFATPAASSNSGLMFANEDIDRKYAYMFGIVSMIIGVATLVIINLPLCNMLFV